MAGIINEKGQKSMIVKWSGRSRSLFEFELNLQWLFQIWFAISKIILRNLLMIMDGLKVHSRYRPDK